MLQSWRKIVFSIIKYVCLNVTFLAENNFVNCHFPGQDRLFNFKFFPLSPSFPKWDLLFEMETRRTTKNNRQSTAYFANRRKCVPAKGERVRMCGRYCRQVTVKGHFRHRELQKKTCSPGHRVQNPAQGKVPFLQCNIQLDQEAVPVVIHPQ